MLISLWTWYLYKGAIHQHLWRWSAYSTTISILCWNCALCMLQTIKASPTDDFLLQEFVPVARELEKNWTRFTPHYIVWICPRPFRNSPECQTSCIHQGRYCTPDPDGDLENGYSGKDIVQVQAPTYHIHKFCHPCTKSVDCLVQLSALKCACTVG